MSPLCDLFDYLSFVNAWHKTEPFFETPSQAWTLCCREARSWVTLLGNPFENPRWLQNHHYNNNNTWHELQTYTSETSYHVGTEVRRQRRWCNCLEMRFCLKKSSHSSNTATVSGKQLESINISALRRWTHLSSDWCPWEMSQQF